LNIPDDTPIRKMIDLFAKRESPEWKRLKLIDGEEEFLQDIVERISSLSPEEAVEQMEQLHLDNDEYLAVWSKLSATFRAKFKEAAKKKEQS
jgi:hypothetical protein